MASLTSTNSLPNWVKLSLRWDNQAQFHWPYRNWTTCTRNELASLGQLLSWLICYAILLDSLGLNEIQVRKKFVPGISASHFFSKCVNWLYSNGLQHHKKCCHCLKRLISFWNKTCPLQRQWKHIIFSCPFIWMQMWPFIQLWPHTGQFQTYPISSAIGSIFDFFERQKESFVAGLEITMAASTDTATLASTLQC